MERVSRVPARTTRCEDGRHTHNVLTRVAVRQGTTSLCRLDLELGHGDDDTNVFREAVADVASDVARRLRRQLVTRLGRTGVGRVGGQNFCERDRGGREL